MSARVYPHESATRMRQVVYQIPATAQADPEVFGGTVTLTLWDGLASDGYKTDYQRRPVRWVEVYTCRADGSRYLRECFRYAGKRYDKADAELLAWGRYLEKVGAVLPGGATIGGAA